MRQPAPIIGRIFNSRAVQPELRRVEPVYLSPLHRAWREAVLERAGRRCEAIDERYGHRCAKAEPKHRMFADHIVELRDGGSYTIGNGQCLCGAHHTTKTMRARANRMR